MCIIGEGPYGVLAVTDCGGSSVEVLYRYESRIEAVVFMARCIGLGARYVELAHNGTVISRHGRPGPS